MKSLFVASLACLISVSAATAKHPFPSVQIEIDRAITKGRSFLKSAQHEDGYWGDPKLPAFTAMALTAIVRDPSLDLSKELPEYVQTGFDWLRKQQKDDGGIYGKGLANYCTSTSVMAFLALNDPVDTPLLLEARRFLINQQSDFDFRGETDNKYDGGIGYGGTYAHSDLSNTHLALTALHHSKRLAEDGKHGRQPTLDWDAAIAFVSRCQNLEETNDLAYASNDEENKGGFIYYPGGTKAGEKDLGNGKVALRSYGSMSYAGLLSLVYADLEENDPRVLAVKEWLGKHYTIDENPGLDQQGLYYYFHTMSKALTAARIDELPLENGKSATWRPELAAKIVNGQREDGSWINPVSRWFENDPILVTAYAMMTLENIHESVPENL